MTIYFFMRTTSKIVYERYFMDKKIRRLHIFI